MNLLSKRLQTIVDFIHASVLADIGCDHGYVCIQAIESNKVEKAYACDVAKKPLENAKKTILAHHLQHKISCVLMNGIERLEKDVDCIVISGMGAELIIQILTSSISRINKNTQCIFCPHKDMNIFYKFCSEYGFDIIEEKVIYEDKHYYHIVNCVYTGIPYPLSDIELYYGKNVVVDSVYKEFMKEEIHKWERIYANMPENKKYLVEDRLNSLKKIRI